MIKSKIMLPVCGYYYFFFLFSCDTSLSTLHIIAMMQLGVVLCFFSLEESLNNLSKFHFFKIVLNAVCLMLANYECKIIIHAHCLQEVIVLLLFCV